jgi:hypothetical protein
MSKGNRRHITHHKYHFKSAVLTVLLFISTLGLTFADIPESLHTRILELNSTVLAESTFEILAESPFAVQMGNDRSLNRVQYRLIANSELQLTISSESSPIGGPLRLAHTTVEGEYIPYQMFFDYAGLGAQNELEVNPDTPKIMENFNQGYDITGSFSFLVPDSETALAGQYQDTITFSFTNPL